MRERPRVKPGDIMQLGGSKMTYFIVSISSDGIWINLMIKDPVLRAARWAYGACSDDIKIGEIDTRLEKIIYGIE
jgi:hypothetical protein